MADYRVLAPAYIKLMLHACQHPSSTCYGLLLGQESGGHFEISDAVPLFHHESPLTPLTEMACTMVDTWCQHAKTQIVGCYYAGASNNGPTLNHTVSKLADQIETNCARACVLAVNNAQLNNEAHSALQLLLKDLKRGWMTVENKLTVGAAGQEDSPMKLLSRALQARNQESIVDMDDHFEDVTKDWRNPHVLELLQLHV